MDAPNDSLVIFTVGHSTHSAERFLELLRVHGIRQRLGLDVLHARRQALVGSRSQDGIRSSGRQYWLIRWSRQVSSIDIFQPSAGCAARIGTR